MKSEQSNTSVAYDGYVMLKLYRRVKRASIRISRWAGR
jgi:hypothetical protein